MAKKAKAKAKPAGRRPKLSMAGRAAIAAAQIKRWKKYRAARRAEARSAKAR